METILEINSLRKVYKSGNTSIIAVKNASFSLWKGEFVALVGPSGSGKTTMLALLAGLLYPTNGKILIGGIDLVQLNDAQRTLFRRQKIGFTFQSNNLIPYLTALENVELMLRLNKQYNPQTALNARNLLIRLGLEERLQSLPAQLSGGEQQRVAIARALIHNPTIVLADEPTAALDTDRAYQVVEILSELIHEQGRTGIMVTHDLRMVEFADRVIQMQDGIIHRFITDRDEILNLAATGKQESYNRSVQTTAQDSRKSTPSLPNPLITAQSTGG